MLCVGTAALGRPRRVSDGGFTSSLTINHN
jgi:hypothetical protein